MRLERQTTTEENEMKKAATSENMSKSAAMRQACKQIYIEPSGYQWSVRGRLGVRSLRELSYDAARSIMTADRTQLTLMLLGWDEEEAHGTSYGRLGFGGTLKARVKRALEDT